MKLGQVLKKERERRGISVAVAAERAGLGVDAYQKLEAGRNEDFEAMGALVVRLNDLFEGQVNQLYYPCGIPFTSVRTYHAET